ncbi:hypothetical protein M501DRAFT_1007747 [Patellaria atrata CBS 101060]|uniref:Microbial-type PARG catalytic domain-containing protein n=1 Tax=Patellaria atrata CBS 101060 TaxID=1346257 RepID=A0A9P4S667_9PEZI|nr:hypothetical protein M501DRAFT_1007747 [Patellaria atrata CBS 101060]
MPPSKPKPSEIAAEAKKTYIPYISQTMPQYPVHSILIGDIAGLHVNQETKSNERLRVAVIDGDPVDVALDWYQYTSQNGSSQPLSQIPVVNMANEKRAGGDWESGLIAPEECFARRSNLVHSLLSPWNPHPTPAPSHYPLPQRGGIYSPSIVVFRDGPEQYEVWREFKSLPVISVAPVRRPKLDETGTKYSFAQERELMLEKMRTVLRIAAAYGHKDLCLGAFGLGPVFRNPVREVAGMWRMLLFSEAEFVGAFSNVVFAIESHQSSPTTSRPSQSELEIFQEEFDPSNVFKTSYR